MAGLFVEVLESQMISPVGSSFMEALIGQC